MRFRGIFPVFLSLLPVILLHCSSSSTDSDAVDVTPPPVPTGLAFQNNTIHNGAASLFWNAVKAKDLLGYNLYWSAGAVVDTATANKRFVETNAALIVGLDYETQYYFGVTALDKSGNESGLSLQINGIPQNTTSPLPPEGVGIAAENIDIPKITVYWKQNSDPDLDHYRVYRTTTQPQPGDPLSLVAYVAGESYTDLNIDIDTPYYYRVTAVDRGGWESAQSSTVVDLALPQVILVSPVDYAYVSERPELVWEPVENALNYYVVVTETRIGGELWDTTLPGSQHQVTYSGKTKLVSGKTYYWRVGAISKTEINSISETGIFVVASE